MILKLSLHLPEEEAFIRTTRLLSRATLDDLRVVKADIDDVETIVGELCSNAIRHSHSAGAHYTVGLEYFSSRVIVTVADEGCGFDPAKVATPGTSRPDGHGGSRVGGFGLSLLEGLSDKLDFISTEPRGTTVRAQKNLHYETKRDYDHAVGRSGDGNGHVVGSSNHRHPAKTPSILRRYVRSPIQDVRPLAINWTDNGSCGRMRKLADLYGIDLSGSTDVELTAWAATSVQAGSSLGVNMRDVAEELKKLYTAAYPLAE